MSKLVVYQLADIQRTMDILRKMKPENMDEARKQIVAFDTLNNRAVQILDVPDEQPAQAPDQIVFDDNNVFPIPNAEERPAVDPDTEGEFTEIRKEETDDESEDSSIRDKREQVYMEDK